MLLPLARKLSLVLNLFGVAAIINYLIMLTGLMSVRLTSFRDFMPHIGFNIAYMILAPACGFFIIWNMRKTELSKGDKVFCFLTCAFAFSLAGLMFTWEFYM
jgi:hypothetical protein